MSSLGTSPDPDHHWQCTVQELSLASQVSAEPPAVQQIMWSPEPPEPSLHSLPPEEALPQVAPDPLALQLALPFLHDMLAVQLLVTGSAASLTLGSSPPVTTSLQATPRTTARPTRDGNIRRVDRSLILDTPIDW